MEKKALYQAVIDNMSEGVCLTGEAGRILLWNKAAEAITGYGRLQALGSGGAGELLAPVDYGGNPVAPPQGPPEALDPAESREVMLHHREGHRIAAVLRFVPLVAEEKTAALAYVFHPLAREEIGDRELDSVTTDRLTGLPNRQMLESYLNYKIQEYRRFGIQFCVLMLNIDGFHGFNAEYGELAGDGILKSLAQTMMGQLRKLDRMGRWQGDEFLGLFMARREGDIHNIGERVRLMVEKAEMVHRGRSLQVTASIGATWVREGDSADSIVARAEALMRASKQEKGNRVTVG